MTIVLKNTGYVSYISTYRVHVTHAPRWLSFSDLEILITQYTRGITRKKQQVSKGAPPGIELVLRA